MWAFMKAMEWSALDSRHIKMVVAARGDGQPQRFIPVFDLKKDALRFAGKDKDLIVKLKTVDK